MAALLYAGPKSLLTGAAAVRRHRLQCAGLNQVDVLVPEDVRVRSAGYVRIIRTGRMPDNACGPGESGSCRWLAPSRTRPGP